MTGIDPAAKGVAGTDVPAAADGYNVVSTGREINASGIVAAGKFLVNGDRFGIGGRCGGVLGGTFGGGGSARGVRRLFTVRNGTGGQGNGQRQGQQERKGFFHRFFVPFCSVIATICRVITTKKFTNKKRQKVKEANTTTPEFLQDAIVADLADLFEGQTLPSSAGDRRPIRVYSQDLPIIEGLDETEDRTEEIPEPYIIVRTNEGNIPDANSAQEIDLILVVCTYDRNPNRQGYRDVLHIIQEIYGRYAKNPLVRIKADSGGVRGGPWSVKYPIKWVTQQEDTHPYYFGAMSLKFEAPAVRQEVPFT